jgi:dolichyl-phosphate beta-glucosyltransferase
VRSREVVVVPCFNEAPRFDAAGHATFPATVGLLFVDDGSTDRTRPMLEAFAKEGRAAGKDIDVLLLDANGGKGEAVRRGLLHALDDHAEVVGFYDADLATPPAEMARLLSILEEHHLDVAMGARVALLGHAIDRKAHRHYLGRVFATCASLILGVPVYDTQCGAKAFRRTPALLAALREPFGARWAFDVELLGRLLAGAPGAAPIAGSAIEEVPLREWHDVGGSSLKPTDFPRLGIELVRIAKNLRVWNRSVPTRRVGPREHEKRDDAS